MNKVDVNVQSEIGKLNAVILHHPGPEIENMIPKNVERALYSDILNLSVASQEYSQFQGVLEKTTNAYQVSDLLKEILEDKLTKYKFVERICSFENKSDVCEILTDIEADVLTKMLIEGVIMEKNTLTKFLDHNRYSLRPLHNFFFTRDSSVTIGKKVLINKMANKIRMREAIIMKAIFENHPILKTKTIEPDYYSDYSFEGGDIQVLRDDILVIGLSQRTNSLGIDFLIEQFKKKDEKRHIIVQQLPDSPESFIHLDMTFTCLDTNKYMVYKPLILDSNQFSTIHITIENGKVTSIEEKSNILTILRELGIDAEPVLCGENKDSYIQEREQWHSGANFFALAPGKVIGYKRNHYTIEAMSKAGFEVIEAKDIISETKSIDDYKRCVVVFDGSELARGGGGARCMTMPVSREAVKW